MRRDAIPQLLPKNLHLPDNVAFLHFFPFIVRVDGTIQVPVDGAAGEIVVDGDFPIRLHTLSNRVYLLVHSNAEYHIPIILPAQPIQRFLFALFAALFFRNELFQRLIA